MRKTSMSCLLRFTAVLATICTPWPAWAQGGGNSLCEVFDHTSVDHRHKSLAIKLNETGNPNTDLQNRFGFKKTLAAILSRAGSSQKPEALVDTLLQSFRTTDTEDRQPRSSLPMKLDSRAGEAGLEASELLNPEAANGMIPVGLFNRFDLAAAEAGHCGEARVVYAKKPSGGRLLLILEGKVTPADSGNGNGKDANACNDVAEFWASLVTMEDDARAEALEKFYFDGDLGEGKPRLAAPPMSFENLGGSDRGQVRGNLFVQGNWQLREWLLNRHNNRLSFDVETVKDNPLTELYDVAKAGDAPEAARRAAETTEFQASFAKSMISGLASDNAVGSGSAVRALSTDIQMVHGFGFGGSTARYDEFQSTAEDADDIPQPDADFQAAISAQAASLGLQLEANHIIARATVLTCHGCHQPGGGFTRPPEFTTEIAPGVAWPMSLQIVHIDESSNLSPALENSFLPFRAAVLEDALCAIGQKVVLESARASARKSLPALEELRKSSKTLSEKLSRKNVPEAEREVLSDVLEMQQQTRRRVERSAPGTFWRFRRTH